MNSPEIDEERAYFEAAVNAFEREIGVADLRVYHRQTGNQQFLKFAVGKRAPLYTHALHEAQQALDPHNPYRGAMGLELKKTETSFPESLEADALLTLLTRSTREVSENFTGRGYRVPYIPFQKGEDNQLAQPASHIIRGRRGAGKSTLIRRVVEHLKAKGSITVTLDMQAYSTLSDESLIREVFHDFGHQVIQSSDSVDIRTKLLLLADQIMEPTFEIGRIPVAYKRLLKDITTSNACDLYVFLDDFHLIDSQSQPKLLHYLHNSMKGANGWLKVAGLSSLLNVYSPDTREGLQVPGDAQFIPLDLTLEDPAAAERHLRKILENFLAAVGYSFTSKILSKLVFRRLVWATAGVPRDFLQMFGQSIRHAQRAKHVSITLSDVNSSIGEFGQKKIEELRLDARNDADVLYKFLHKIEKICLDKHKVNAFLVKNDESEAAKLVKALSDLRMIHLIRQSITPDRAGERYDAYIVDYSIFTGFRRRPNVREMLPEEEQFKVAELRALPKIPTEPIHSGVASEE